MRDQCGIKPLMLSYSEEPPGRGESSGLLQRVATEGPRSSPVVSAEVRAPGRNRTCDSRFRNSFTGTFATSTDGIACSLICEFDRKTNHSLLVVSLPFAEPPRDHRGTLRTS